MTGWEAVVHRCSSPVPQTFNFIKKRLWHRCFPCAFCKISKNTFLTEHFWTTVSAELKKFTWRQSCIYIVKFISFWLYTHFYMNNLPLKLNVIIVEQILRLKFFFTCSLQMLSLPFFVLFPNTFLLKIKLRLKESKRGRIGQVSIKRGASELQYSTRSKEFLDIQAITVCKFTLNTNVTW